MSWRDASSHLLAILADVLQSHSIALRVCDAVSLPHHLVKTFPPAMQGVWRIVCCQLVGCTFQSKFGIGYAVGHTTHHSAKVRAPAILQQST